MIGPIVLPTPPITPNIAIPLALLLSSNISAMYVFPIEILPFKKPQRNLAATDIQKLWEKPNKSDETHVPIKPKIRTGLLPTLSANTPHRKLPNSEPVENALPIMPARKPISFRER